MKPQQGVKTDGCVVWDITSETTVAGLNSRGQPPIETVNRLLPLKLDSRQARVSPQVKSDGCVVRDITSETTVAGLNSLPAVKPQQGVKTDGCVVRGLRTLTKDLLGSSSIPVPSKYILFFDGKVNLSFVFTPRLARNLPRVILLLRNASSRNQEGQRCN